MLTLIALIIIFAVLFLIFKDVKKDQPQKPVPYPPVTPPAIMSGIILGYGRYRLKDDPESVVTAISVYENQVEFEDTRGNISYLPVEEFLLKYEPRRIKPISYQYD